MDFNSYKSFRDNAKQFAKNRVLVVFEFMTDMGRNNFCILLMYISTLNLDKVKENKMLSRQVSTVMINTLVRRYGPGLTDGKIGTEQTVSLSGVRPGHERSTCIGAAVGGGVKDNERMVRGYMSAVYL